MFPGVNLSDRDEGWEQNFREPDVAVFLRDGKAINCGTHWQGAADFLVEIISPGERTREKIPFYSSLGVVELLVDRPRPLDAGTLPPPERPVDQGRPIHAGRARRARQPDGRPDVPTPPRRTPAADPSDAPGQRAEVGDMKLWRDCACGRGCLSYEEHLASIKPSTTLSVRRPSE